MLVAWVMALQMFSAVCLWVKAPTKCHSRTAPTVLTYSVFTALPGATFLTLRPQLLWQAVVFVSLASSAVYLVRKGRKRSLGTRVTPILAGNIVGPAVFSLTIADGPPAAVTLHVWVMCTAFGLCYIGTVPLVRSIIRSHKGSCWTMGSAPLHVAFTLRVAVAR